MREKAGKFLGKGKLRNVYEHKDNPEWAIKISHRPTGGKNKKEHWLWHNAPPHIKKWLVPVIDISECGQFLVVEKGEPVTQSEVPKFRQWDGFRDTKKALNWVRIKGKVLLADYHIYDKNRLF